MNFILLFDKSLQFIRIQISNLIFVFVHLAPKLIDIDHLVTHVDVKFEESYGGI